MFGYKKILSPLALSLSLALSGSAFAGQHTQSADKDTRQIFKQLELSNAQRQDIRQFSKQTRQDRGVYTLDMRDLTQNIRALVQSSTWDEQAVHSALSRRQVLQTTLALRRAQQKHQLWRLLSTQQQAKLLQLTEQREPKKRAGKHKGKYIKKLGLSEQQSAAFKELKSQLHADREASSATRQGFKLEERALIHAEVFSPNDWLALKAKYQQAFLAMALTGVKNKHQRWQILTPEQQGQARENRSKHEAKKPQGKKGNSKST